MKYTSIHMKKLLLLIIATISITYSYSQVKKTYIDTLQTALIIIDIQESYFDETKSPLTNRFEATINVQKLLELFREKGNDIIHVQHKGGGEIRELLKPLKNEKIITKTNVNAFIDTDLEEYLQNKNIDQLIICGMMTQMCVEGAVRAAADLDYKVIVPSDACATRDLEYNNIVIPAKQVHAATLQSFTFGGYAKIDKTDNLIKIIK